MPRNLSKSKLIAYRQCPKRLWLEVHRPDLREDSAAAQARFNTGYAVGEIAQRLYDPKHKGTLINAQEEGYEAALKRSISLLNASQPIFEAGFASSGAIAFADIMLPATRGGKRAWRMVEIKSATSLKDYHRDDAAIQAFVARKAGVPLASIVLAHIDSDWIYPGNDDYRGLFNEVDLTAETLEREEEVIEWITQAHAIVAKRKCPARDIGSHCSKPFECGFYTYCASDQPETEYPIHWLPKVQKKDLKEFLSQPGIIDMRQVPDTLLNEKQLRVKQHSLANTCYFDSKGSRQALSNYGLPAYFLDFETAQFAVPIWKGTKPYQQLAFQFSLHRISRSGKVEHEEFIDLSGADPSKPLAEALIAACGKQGPIFAYNAGFEKSRISELAARFPRSDSELLAIRDRVVDLLPIAEQHFYHPSQQGSWSIKSLLPAITDKDYESLDGVKNGGMAMEAYMEALAPETSQERRDAIRRELLAYCKLDTDALIDVWRLFSGQ